MLNQGVVTDERTNSFGKTWEKTIPLHIPNKAIRKSNENSLGEEKLNYGLRKFSDNRNAKVYLINNLVKAERKLLSRCHWKL